ncbi:MAG: antitoxin family protein [Pyrinomonadaceae bacterium]
MPQKITAVYENGILRPLTPIDLPENTEVKLDIHLAGSAGANMSHLMCVRQALNAAGLIRSSLQSSSKDELLPPERLAELASLFSTTRPLGELISEEREGR